MSAPPVLPNPPNGVGQASAPRSRSNTRDDAEAKVQRGTSKTSGGVEGATDDKTTEEKRSRRKSKEAEDKPDEYDDVKFIDVIERFQRTIRIRVKLFQHYGPCLFCDRSGEAAAFGRIQFETGFCESRFLQVSDQVPMPLLATFMLKHWMLKSPEVIFSVTGGAAEFKLTSAQRVAFCHGLMEAAHIAKAWIVTGGTDSGVMKLVGEAAANAGATTPTIGIVPWGVIDHKDDLKKCAGGDVTYPNAPDGTGAPARLNPNHSHFVMVDNNVTGPKAFGNEVGVRTGLEKYLLDSFRVPVVSVVVQGGPGTMNTVLGSAETGNPIVLLADSGGFAEALYWWHLAAKKAKDGRVVDDNNLLSKEDAELFPFLGDYLDKLKTDLREKIVTGLNKLMQLHKEHGHRLLIFFSSGGDKEGCRYAESLAPTLLFSLTNLAQNSEKGDATDEKEITVNKRRNKMLTLAINWGQPQMVRDILGYADYSRETARALITPLFRALALGRAEIVEMLLKVPGIDVGDLKMCQLYDYRLTGADYYRLKHMDKELKHHFKDKKMVQKIYGSYKSAEMAKEQSVHGGSIHGGSTHGGSTHGSPTSRRSSTTSLEGKADDKADVDDDGNKATSLEVKADDKADVDDDGNKAIGIGVFGKLAVGKTSWVARAKAGVLQRSPTKKLDAAFAGVDDGLTTELDRLHHRRMYRDVVGPFLGELSPILKGVLTADVNGATRIADLYFWALIDGNWPLAMVLWKRSERPIHLAALGAYTCERIAKKVFIGRAELHDQAARLSQIAEGVLDMATDDKRAFEVLEMDAAPSVEKHYTLIDIALQCKLQNLLASRHCSSLLDLWWRGGFRGSRCKLGEGFSWLLLALYVCVAWLVAWVPSEGKYLPGSGELVEITDKRKSDKAVLPQSAHMVVAVKTLCRALRIAKQQKLKNLDGVLDQVVPKATGDAPKSTGETAEDAIQRGEVVEAVEANSSAGTATAKPPLPALTAYDFYKKNFRGLFTQEHPKITLTEEIDKALNAEYDGLDADGKAPYEAKAVADKERYEKENALYKASVLEKTSRLEKALKEKKVEGNPAMKKDLDNIFAKVMKQNAAEVTAQEENSRHVPLLTRICQSRLASFYNIPAVSALLRLFVSVIRVVVMAAVLMSFERVYGSEAMSGLGDESPALAWEGDGSEFATPLPLNRWEVAWMVFGLGTLIDKAQQHSRMVRAKLTYLSGNNFWSMLGRTQQMLFVFNAALRLVICFATMGHDVASRLYSAYEIIFSVATAVTTLMILPQVTMFSEGFLLLVLIFENLLYDLMHWVALVSFFIVAFVLCFTGLYNAGWMTTPSAQFANNNGPLAAPLWALFGSWNYDNFGEAMPLYTPAPVLLFTYALFANLALVNLLIAMFSDTYNKLTESAQGQAAMNRCTDLFLQRKVQLMLPPPVNAPLALLEMLNHKLVDRLFPTGVAHEEEAHHAEGVTQEDEKLREAYVDKHGVE